PYIIDNKGINIVNMAFIIFSALLGAGFFALSLCAFVGIIKLSVITSVICLGLALGGMLFSGSMSKLAYKNYKEYINIERELKSESEIFKKNITRLKKYYKDHEKSQELIIIGILKASDIEIITVLSEEDISNAENFVEQVEKKLKLKDAIAKT
ncbi:MAG: hypothetical protein ACXVHT_09900, partial [Methanobacterium sp.]